jgi:hemin uptake protein HemP
LKDLRTIRIRATTWIVEKDPEPAGRRAPSEERAAPARTPLHQRRIPSAELLGERAEVEILHNEEVYRLRRTRGGKLILTK